MARSRAVAWAVACLATAACAAPGSTSVDVSASCAGPYVETRPRQAQPGSAISLYGEGHVDACYDTGQPRQADALDDLPVVFSQGTSSRELSRLDASLPGGVVRTTITVPADARPGLAEITVGSAEPALVLVGDGRGGYPPWPGPPAGPFELTVDLVAVPSSPDGGWVLASATTVDFQVPDAEKTVTAVAPLGAAQISLGAVVPTYWTVDVSVHRCERAGCPPPTRAGDGPACPMEVRVLDGPARMTYRQDGPDWCELRGTG